jgi:hypothetical protein
VEAAILPVTPFGEFVRWSWMSFVEDVEVGVIAVGVVVVVVVELWSVLTVKRLLIYRILGKIKYVF